MIAWQRRTTRRFRPGAEMVESRVVLSSGASLPGSIIAILRDGGGAQPVRPNTPVLPFESAYPTASFLDPAVRINAGERIAIGQKDFVAPFAKLDAARGYIKIGDNTAIQDHASLIANPGQSTNPTGIVVGDNVAIADGARVLGPATIGADRGAATSIGANALIDGATIEPGAFVGALARVGPGVTVPAGFRVRPGSNVTTNAEASDPALGLVVRVAAADTTALGKVLSNNAALASGYSQLYQGNSATGGPNATSGPIPTAVATPGSGIYFGSLRPVEGIGPEPGTKLVSFEPTQQSPRFVLPNGKLKQVNNYAFTARVTGQVLVGQTQANVARAIGPRVSIRGDEGQPITIGSLRRIGPDVSIHSPGGNGSTGRITIGKFLRARAGAVILGGATPMMIGDSVTIGSGSVVADSSIGAGAVVGNRSYVANSTIAPDAVVPDGAIVINNVRVGTVAW